MLGTTLDGRYELVAELGSGGMADIFRAEDRHEGRSVAVKILKGRKAVAPEYRERFQREYTLCKDLDHPNIVRMYDFGHIDEHRAYYVMELLPRRSLADVVGARGPLPEAEVCAIVAQLLDAFTYYHGRDIVHRDLKPDNVMVRDDGTVAITDFGIARASDQAPLTSTGITMGTPNYISPEVLLGQDADARSDIFALGIIAYELLTGRNPFGAKDLSEVVEKIVRSVPPPPCSVRAGLSAGWDGFVGRCLAKAPDKRYQTAAEVRADLRLLQGALGLPPSPDPVEGTAATEPRGRTCGATAAAVMAAGAAGLLAWW